MQGASADASQRISFVWGENFLEDNTISVMGSAQAKTGVEGLEQAEMVRGMVHEYVRGLCWVMRYYYDGAPAR